MKRSNIVRKQARRRCWNKAGCWRVKISVNSVTCESLDWCDAVCWQITQRSFVSDWEWHCVVQCDAGHTRIKTKLDKIGTKKQEVKQSVLTLSSLMLKPNRNRTFDAMTWSDFSIFPGSVKTRSAIKHQVKWLLTGWQKMGETTKCQSSWDNKTDENGDYLIKQAEE